MIFILSEFLSSMFPLHWPNTGRLGQGDCTGSDYWRGHLSCTACCPHSRRSAYSNHNTNTRQLPGDLSVRNRKGHSLLQNEHEGLAARFQQRIIRIKQFTQWIIACKRSRSNLIYYSFLLDSKHSWGCVFGCETDEEFSWHKGSDSFQTPRGLETWL